MYIVYTKKTIFVIKAPTLLTEFDHPVRKIEVSKNHGALTDSPHQFRLQEKGIATLNSLQQHLPGPDTDTSCSHIIAGFRKNI
jgi:hypothetical protein